MGLCGYAAPQYLQADDRKRNALRGAGGTRVQNFKRGRNTIVSVSSLSRKANTDARYLQADDRKRNALRRAGWGRQDDPSQHRAPFRRLQGGEFSKTKSEKWSAIFRGIFLAMFWETFSAKFLRFRV